MRMVGVHPADTQYAQAGATPQPTPTTSQASAISSPVAGNSGNWTAATMPGGNARPFYVTGYTATGNPTYTGTVPHWGTVAVDPHIIPLGSTVYIQGLGVFTAEDTGGFIIGYRVDVFVPTTPEAYAITGLRLVSFIPPGH
jgi:3D (Asp-Asp-Asp) domain-containing protein